MAYNLGPVKPHVAKTAIEVGSRFGVRTIYGWGTRSGPTDHDDGLALDFKVYEDSAKGDAIAAYGEANWNRLGLTYIIWKQRIKKSANGPWEPMGDRGSVTANHYDHNHWSFSGTGKALPAGVPVMVREDGNWLADANTAASWVTDTHNWLRIGMVTGGAILIVLALWKASMEGT